MFRNKNVVVLTTGIDSYDGSDIRQCLKTSLIISSLTEMLTKIHMLIGVLNIPVILNNDSANVMLYVIHRATKNQLKCINDA